MKCSYIIVPVLALLALPLLGLLTVSVPEGCSEPSKLRIQLTAFKFINKLASAATYFYGPEYGLRFFRHVIDVSAQYKPPPSPNPKLKVTDAIFDGVPVKVYKPASLPPDGPGIVFYHGGGWVFGSAEMYDDVMRPLAEETSAVVVSVDYRLAPEHPYPTPRMDCEAATKYFIDHALDYGVDPERIAIAGDSAGGNLAAAVALSLRDQEFYPRPKVQVLIYPILQPMDFNLPSYHINEYHPIVSKKGCISAWLRYGFGNVDHLDYLYENMHTTPSMKQEIGERYLSLDIIPERMIPQDYQPTQTNMGNSSLWSEIKHRFMDPLFAPLMSDDLSDLPNALVMTVESDTLRDDGLIYAHRLREAGVKTELKHYDHTVHGILSIVKFKDSKDMRKDIVKYIKDNI